jgi:hypothetical protein
MLDNSIIIGQLCKLATAFTEVGVRPVICGGLGIYLSLHGREKDLPLRTTNDIDLMLTKQQVLEEARRKAISEIITGSLDYRVCEDGKYFMFEKDDQPNLDILTQPIDGVEGIDIEGFRAKIVKSCLHAYITQEACFIEEDMRTIPLSELLLDDKEAERLEVCVPSPTNLLILKLFAFNDRDSGERQDDDKARAHAYDIYVLITLANQEDYREGLKFLERHRDSLIIQTAQSIVRNKFSGIEHSGWQSVLESSDFYSGYNRKQKEERLDEARRRLRRWFNVS